MKLHSFSEHSSGWLALLCAIAVFVAAAIDAPGETAPAAATVVGAAP
jgi:hypothetical protein